MRGTYIHWVLVGIRFDISLSPSVAAVPVLSSLHHFAGPCMEVFTNVALTERQPPRKRPMVFPQP